MSQDDKYGIDLSSKLHNASSVPNGDSSNHESNDKESQLDTHEQLLFFNYHEISINTYTPLMNETTQHPLIVTHFPNPYDTTSDTRIVRIPRDYTISKDDSIPFFSNVLPGFEKLALLEPISTNSVDVKGGGERNFIIRGCVKSQKKNGDDEEQWFGYSSVSPLSNYLNLEEFTEILDKINNLIDASFNSLQTSYMIWTILDSLLLTIPSTLRLNHLKFWDKGKYDILESYITELNDPVTGKIGSKNLRIISPRASGFLSLDFEIPKPVPVSEKI